MYGVHLAGGAPGVTQVTRAHNEAINVEGRRAAAVWSASLRMFTYCKSGSEEVPKFLYSVWQEVNTLHTVIRAAQLVRRVLGTLSGLESCFTRQLNMPGLLYLQKLNFHKYLL